MTERRLRRPHLYHSPVNVAVSKSGQTVTSAFIAQQQRQILGKVKNSKPSGHRDDQDVAKQPEEEGTVAILDIDDKFLMKQNFRD